MKTIEEEHYSKYLLVDERKDEIIGVVSVKDIILTMGNQKEFNLREIARPPLFIPESLYANKVLELFKKNKNKFGVVVNEYGSTEGIITLHDLTESIFGDILEEDEMEEEEIVTRQGGSFNEYRRLHGGNGYPILRRSGIGRLHHSGWIGHVPDWSHPESRRHLHLQESAIRSGGHGPRTSRQTACHQTGR